MQNCKGCAHDVPNLFHWATSELSQDAFLAWLMEWADPKYRDVDVHLHSVAVQFVRSLIKCSLREDVQIESVEVMRQWNKIDVSAVVNRKYFIIIEDKTGTSEHSNQLQRYVETVNKSDEWGGLKLVCIYYKMEEQGDLSAVTAAGYYRFTRHDMLAILRGYCANSNAVECNEILCDYYRSLCDLDARVASYKTLPPDTWEWFSWQGFYVELQKQLQTGEWGYVANPSGGFLGFWWKYHAVTLGDIEGDAYLQLEEDRLVFKLAAQGDSATKRRLRDAYREAVFKAASDEGVTLVRHGRLATWMSVAKWSGDYRVRTPNGPLDMEATVNNLRKAEKILESAVSEIRGDANRIQ